MSKELKFTVFADFHYRENMYMSSVEDMKEIIARAKKDHADFIVHARDMCNDYHGSPELVDKTYLACDLPVYGVYGNHELEAQHNCMEKVTPKLTNRSDEVCWGTPDGKIGDGTIGYYYFDKGDYRFVMLDTNYSYSDERKVWEHYAPTTCGPHENNIRYNSVAPAQLQWLETVLQDAADKHLHCMIVGHACANAAWSRYGSDLQHEVQDIFRRVNQRKQGTVMMVINGHQHENHVGVYDNILYFDVNTTRNGYWRMMDHEHYTAEHTATIYHYDEYGNETGVEAKKPLYELWQSKNTWYFDKPLSACVTISDGGKICIRGMKAGWIYGMEPDESLPRRPESQLPAISDFEATIQF